MKCSICNKSIKENTEGNKRYCQGHFIWEDRKKIVEDRDGKKHLVLS